MSRLARGIISAACILVSIPFGIIFAVMVFIALRKLGETGNLYVMGFADYIFMYVFLNFVFSFIMGATLALVNSVGRRLLITLIGITVILLLLDLQGLVIIVKEITSGRDIGFPWTTVLMLAHGALLVFLVRASRGSGAASAPQRS